MKKFRSLITILVSVMVIFAFTGAAHMQQQPSEPPPPAGFPHVDADWYVPGAIHKFASAVVLDGKGNIAHVPTYNSEQTPLAMPSGHTRGPFSGGKYRGEANLWFSGNAVWAYASSTLTSSLKEGASSRQICARVVSFHVQGSGNPQTTPEACQNRRFAWDWVTTESRTMWSGCSVVAFDQVSRAAINDSAHRFQKADGSDVPGGSSTRVDFRCVVGS